jgi:hypothetical protein
MRVVRSDRVGSLDGWGYLREVTQVRLATWFTANVTARFTTASARECLAW